MSGVDRRNVDMLRNEFERQMTNFAENQKRINEVTATAVSPRRELSVTLGPQGTLMELNFLSSAYRRLAKNELSELVMKTIADARGKLNDQLAEIMTPMMPPGLDIKAVLEGKVSAEKLAPDESRLPALLRERLNRG
ncbi:YbaB/EbfC family nucleoid-associated protein [Kibdelosporangium phytohabitans]|uniref:YbaB/EbfC DNA-binding family protein n=1 Tax=Kibdelosporangium phytohabitans TaxID=860235 RepID=A0A0N9IBD4_9PSEU|nr:YbaB/EbfC family nucleoid-associated protein [Kibdelosporangium phytohabitans]ALG12009.1 hypothetical protein AOZ06_38665 [Kibdelosporangium phytohabitans]MBE1463481.1 DNA-binding protein YbaB [Kibdelosporangium phytohabitans]